MSTQRGVGGFDDMNYKKKVFLSAIYTVCLEASLEVYITHRTWSSGTSRDLGDRWQIS